MSMINQWPNLKHSNLIYWTHKFLLSKDWMFRTLNNKWEGDMLMPLAFSYLASNMNLDVVVTHTWNFADKEMNKYFICIQIDISITYFEVLWSTLQFFVDIFSYTYMGMAAILASVPICSYGTSGMLYLFPYGYMGTLFPYDLVGTAYSV